MKEYLHITYLYEKKSGRKDFSVPSNPTYSLDYNSESQEGNMRGTRMSESVFGCIVVEATQSGMVYPPILPST